MKKEKWIWMPHPAHFICSDKCQFKLATYVGKYIVSTVGEYLPDSQVREIEADVKNIRLEGKGDAREIDFLNKIGFVEIGLDRLYETLVFRAKKRKDEKNRKCCPYEIIVERELDGNGYNTAADATKGHYALCEKWGKK